MFITTKVFDPSLEGQAVTLSGSLIEGNFIVAKVHNYEIEIIGSNLNLQQIPLDDFEHNAIKMQILKAPSQSEQSFLRTGFDSNIDKIVDKFEEKIGDMMKDGSPEQPGRGKHNGNFKRRNQGTREYRTNKQRDKENAAVERILRINGGPMRLAKIIQTMRDLGYTHWRNNNASGFVKHAIRSGKKIHKVELGIYAYGRKAGE